MIEKKTGFGLVIFYGADSFGGQQMARHWWTTVSAVNRIKTKTEKVALSPVFDQCNRLISDACLSLYQKLND